MAVSLLVVMRLVAACICAGGAVWIASKDGDGWGWFLFAAIILGSVTVETTGTGTKAD